MSHRARQGKPTEKDSAAVDSASGGPIERSSTWSVPRSPPRLWPLLAILAAQAIFIAIVYSLASFGSAPGMMVPLDAIALPGEDATIGVRFEPKTAQASRASFARARVSFFETDGTVKTSAERPVLEATAGAGGVASLVVKAPANPSFRLYRARLDDPRRIAVERPEEDVLLEVVRADNGLLLVLVPQAVTDETGDTSFAGAATALQALTKDRAIVYIATRKMDHPGRLRALLASRGFPLGPVLIAESASGGTLRELVADMKLSRWKGPLWGIAVTGREASALASGGLRVVLLGLVPSPEVDGRTVFLAHNWNEARKKIEAGR